MNKGCVKGSREPHREETEVERHVTSSKESVLMVIDMLESKLMYFKALSVVNATLKTMLDGH